MKNYKHSTTILPNIFFILLSFVLGATPVFAHRSPDTCTGSGLQISLYTNLTEVHIGDLISYSVDVYNGLKIGPVVCDATDITASIVTPDGQNHPITLLRTTLLNGQVDSYTNVVTYTARTQDVKTDGTLTATAVDTGKIHQNDTDSDGGANQGVNTTVLTNTPPVVVSPPVIPTSPSGGGGCAYGYNFQLNRCNYTPVIPPPVTPPPVIITQNILPNTPMVLGASDTKFPNAGFGPDERSFPFGIVLFVGVLTLFAATSKTYMYVINKK